jgi:uncharacterized protein involved in response to NO
MTINSIEKILALFTALIWGIFTLIPNSHSLMATWGWVLIWQIGLVFPLLWFLLLLWQQKIYPLGQYVDWFVSFITIGIIISSLFASFSHQGRWYSWAAICLIASLYTVTSYLKIFQQKYRLIIIQGYLSFAFIFISLYLWLTETLILEKSRLNILNQKYNIDLKFDFSVLELRNWAPIGHQNYVAGYLLLSLPILVGLAIIQKGWRRYFWLTGLVLGLVDLYSTSSRGGWLGLTATCIVSLFILLFRSKLSRFWLGLASLSVFSLLITSLLVNNRLTSLFSGGEFAYRWINANIGWQMGISHPFTGVGLGGVPLFYQKYRPAWAGRESELAYQLHSTPVQLFAEMGIWGLLGYVGAIVLLIHLFYRSFKFNRLAVTEDDRDLEFNNRTINYCIFAGFLGYLVISITDYQLDNLAISGTLVLFLACLLFSTSRPTVEGKSLKRLLRTKFLPIILTTILLLSVFFLYPINRAWQLSSQGFLALSEDKIDIFVEKLEAAHNIAPWEAYYPYQLGWNLGNLSLNSTNVQQQQQLLRKGIEWFEKANQVSPYQEFGYTNIGWLLLRNNPAAATKSFVKAAELVPAKQGNFSSIAISLLLQKKLDLAVEAFTLEALRDPLLITSPIWKVPSLQSLYPQIIDNLDKKYTELNKKYTDTNYWYTCQISLAWWQKKLAKTREKLKNSPNPLLDLIINLEEGKNITDKLAKLPDSPAKLIITAWLFPQQRTKLIKKAWVLVNKDEIKPEILQNHLESMAKSTNFSQWLRENAPSWSYRKERTGFGIVSRHLDGATPTDFNQVTENIPMETWFSDLFPTAVYAPELDLALTQWRMNLLRSL